MRKLLYFICLLLLTATTPALSAENGGIEIKSVSETVGEDSSTYTLRVKNTSGKDAAGYIISGIYYGENELKKVYTSKAEITAYRGKTFSLEVPNKSSEFAFNSEIFCENSEICIKNGNYGVANAFDGQQKSIFGISNLTKSDIIFSFKYPANVTSMSFRSVNNFDWAMAKEYEILVYNDKNVYGKAAEPVSVGTITLSQIDRRQTVDLGDYDGLSGVTHLILRPKSAYISKTGAVWGGFYEIGVYGTVKSTVKVFYWNGNGEPMKIHESNMTANTAFSYKGNMFCENPEINISSGNYGVANAFDGNLKTIFGIGKLTENDIVFSFKYPADITALSFWSVNNGDWAMAKEYEILVYNDENIYRNKTKNPVSVGTFTLEKTEDEQRIDLSGYNGLSGVTHLVLRPKSAYISKTGAVWGGFYEMRVYGTQDRNEIPTEKTVTPEIQSNAELLKSIGVSVGDGKLTAARITEVMLKLGFDFPQNTSTAAMSGDEFYALLADSLGMSKKELIVCGLYSLGGIEEMTSRELGIGICEALMLPIKSDGADEGESDTGAGNSQKYACMADKLYAEGKISELLYTHLLDKLDVYAAAHMEEYKVPTGASVNSEFTFSRTQNPKQIKNVNFCYNMPFHYKGGFLGTLPESDSRSRRAEFAENLKTAGAKSLRFPGGLPSHQYFIEGEKYAQKLSRDIRKWGGLYDVNNENNNYCIDFYNFLDFCRENDIEPIFQVNTSFYVEPSNDKIYAICKNSYVASKNGTVNSAYYDRDRFTEAAAALGANIDKMLDAGYKIKYWELGNEDFATANYLDTELSDANNPAEDNYAKLSAEFAKVIKAKIPDAVIIATGGFPKLEEKYKALGVYEIMDYVSAHYPYSHWTMPSGDDKDNLTALLTTNEQEFVKNSSGDSRGGAMARCTTETATWKFECWESWKVNATFAMALNTAHQWGELVFETPWEISTIHDLESPYFGALMYDMRFNPETRQMAYAGEKLRISEEDMPQDYSFPGEYMLNPWGRVFGIMSEHTGGYVLSPDEGSPYRLISAFASEKDGKITVTAVNKTDTERQVKLRFSGIRLPSQTAAGKCMLSENPAAVTAREYDIKTAEIRVAAGDEVSFTAEPYSVYQFVLCE